MKKKNQFLTKVIDRLFSIQRTQTYCCVWDKVLHIGHYLIAAHTSCLP